MPDKSNKSKDLPRLHVTDHALVRYMERIERRSFRKLYRKICSDKVRGWIKTLGDGDYPVDNEFYIRVKSNRVVTIIPIKE